MPYVAAIPCIGLLAGAAAGLLLPSLPAIPTLAMLLVCGALSLLIWRANPRVLVSVVAIGFSAGGSLLSVSAWQRAWRPPLWTAFEQLACDQRANAEADGRRLPEDDEASAVIEGVLQA